MSVPQTFRAELRAHNRHALAAAIASLVAAVVLWNLAYFFFVLILLGLTTSARGEIGAQMPSWIPFTAFALAGVLFLWGVVDAWRRRFARLDDRAIIGWHLIPDFLLLPVRVTFAVWGNLSAIRRLPEDEIVGAWELLATIRESGKARLSALTMVEPHPERLHRLLDTLQLLGYIDLLQGERDWFYVVRSTREQELRALKND